MICPNSATWKSFAEGDLEEEGCKQLEEHLDACTECRHRAEQILSDQTESQILTTLGSWKREQDTFRKSLDSVLASSFRLRGKIDPNDFAFVQSADGSKVEGRLGELELREWIGTGGMGVVFRAWDPALEREVAVKVLRTEFAGDEQITRLFLDEARAVAALQHENVLPIYDVARDDGSEPYLVMPLIDGGRLLDRLQNGEPLSRAELVEIATKTARSLAAAHGAGILHRDVKPANILLEGEGKSGVWLADFGLARAARYGFGEGSVVGTEGYLAPEEKRSGGSEAADLYAFGAVLRDLLDASPSDEALSGERDWIARLADELQKENPGDRPADAEEVVHRLEEGWANEEKHRRSFATRRRHRKIILTMTTVFGLICLGGIAIDIATGRRLGNRLLVSLTGDPVYREGKYGTYPSIEEALATSDPDLALWINPTAELAVDDCLVLSNRRVSIRSNGIERPRFVFSRGLERGFFSLEASSLFLEGIELRFRGGPEQPVEGLIRLRNSQAELKNVFVRRSGARPRAPGALAIFSLRGSNEVEVSDLGVMAERSGSGLLVVGTEGTKNEIAVRRLRFVGENLLHIVSPDPGSGDHRAALSVSVERSTIISASAVRFGPGAPGVETAIKSANSLWQGSGPFLAIREDDAEEVQTRFSLSNEASLFAVGGDRAVETGVASTMWREVANPSDPSRVEKDWRNFRGNPTDGENDPDWVDWIVRYRPGRPPIWNEAVDIEELGAQGKIEFFR